MAYANPRVKLFSQYLMKDDKPRKGKTALERFSGFETGLRTYKGKRKPAYNGFMLPLAVTAVRVQRRALGPRPAGGRRDPGRDPAQGRQARLGARRP